MLLIEPPLDLNDWVNLQLDDPDLERIIGDYCDRYEAAVLSLPGQQLWQILSHFGLLLPRGRLRPETFHGLVERELCEAEFEPSTKVATLVVLCALARSLQDIGFRLQNETVQLVSMCERQIPMILIAAINDHYALLPEHA